MRHLALLLMLLLTPNYLMATVLGTAAQNLAVGGFVEVTGTTGLTAALVTAAGTGCLEGGVAHNIFEYSHKAVWDRRAKKMWYYGGGHQSGNKLISYDDATNTFTDFGKASWAPECHLPHGYQHNAINPWLGYFYHRPINDLTVRRYNISTATWASLPAITGKTFNVCCAGLEYDPDRGKLVFVGQESGTLADAWEFQEGDAAWTNLLGTTGFEIGGIHSGLIYNPVHHLLVAYGGSQSKAVHKINAPGERVRLTDFAGTTGFDNNADTSILTVDPVSGDLVVFAEGAGSGQLWKYVFETDAWTRLTSLESGIQFYNSSGTNGFWGMVLFPIDTYGVIGILTCGGQNNCSGPGGGGVPKFYIYKHVGQNSFQSKCADSGVLHCKDFDRETDRLFYNWTGGNNCDTALAGKTNYSLDGAVTSYGNTHAQPNALASCKPPIIDTAIKKDGGGSLKFTIQSRSGSGDEGYYRWGFAKKGDGNWIYISPAAGAIASTVYMQFHQRFDTNFQGVDYACTGGTCGGWKQLIWYGNPPLGSSASSIEVTHNNGWQRDVPQMYGQQGSDDYGVEDIINCTFANATSGGGPGSGFVSRPNYQGPLNPNCKHYAVDTWVEFTVRVDVIGVPNAATSRVRLWLDGAGPVIDFTTAKINHGSADGDGIGSFSILPYHTNKDSAQVHAEGYTWVDNLIVSTNSIPMMQVVGETKRHRIRIRP